jgi:hypothetical protein
VSLPVEPEFAAELKVTRAALTVHAEHDAALECTPDADAEGMCHLIERRKGYGRRPG